MKSISHDPQKSEQPLRVGLWYIGVGVGNIIGSLLSFGFQHYEGKAFTSWQLLFLVVGLTTVCLEGTVLSFLPDSLIRCKFLTREEKLWTVERLRENQTDIENKIVKPEQILEFSMDPQTWLLSLIMITANVPNGAVSSYQATIIHGFCHDSKTTALLQLPSGAVSIVSVLVAPYSAGWLSQMGSQHRLPDVTRYPWSMPFGVLAQQQQQHLQGRIAFSLKII